LGSPDEHAAADWIAAQLGRFGVEHARR
jgi:hypothetical protein